MMSYNALAFPTSFGPSATALGEKVWVKRSETGNPLLVEVSPMFFCCNTLFIRVYYVWVMVLEREFVIMPEFEKRWQEAGLNDDALKELQSYLCLHPKTGLVIPGTGGLRKLRWGIDLTPSEKHRIKDFLVILENNLERMHNHEGS